MVTIRMEFSLECPSCKADMKNGEEVKNNDDMFYYAYCYRCSKKFAVQARETAAKRKKVTVITFMIAFKEVPFETDHKPFVFF